MAPFVMQIYESIRYYSYRIRFRPTINMLSKCRYIASAFGGLSADPHRPLDPGWETSVHQTPEVHRGVSVQVQYRRFRYATRLNTVAAGWLGSRVVSVLDSGAVGSGFKSQWRRCRVTVLGKLLIGKGKGKVNGV